jgi:hypothetical protein
MKNIFSIVAFLFFSISIGISQESQSMSEQYENKKPSVVKGTKKSISKRFEIIEDKENLLRTDITNYNEKGNRVELITSNYDSSDYYRFEYKYDTNNNRTSLISYRKNGVVKSKIEMKYDEYNNNIETISWSSSSGSRRYYREYDKNELIKLITYNGVIKNETIYKYDSKGRKISELRYEDGKLIKKILTEFEDYK